MIMTVGEKLKELRKSYNLNQDDVVGKEVTRNLISQIEHGKANLTRNTAELIIKNTITILKQRGISLDKNINVDYLLESEESQAEKLINQYIKELKEVSVYKGTHFNDILKTLDSLLLKWDFPSLKIQICEIAGDYFTSISEYYRASVYYENIRYLINNENEYKKLVPILRKLSLVYYYMGRIKEGIKVCKDALDRFEDMDDEYKLIFTFNMALYYNNLGNYESALNIIKNFEYKFKLADKNKYNEVLLLKASCLQELKHHAEALTIYSELLKSTPKDDINNSCVYYNNMAEIYIEIGLKDNALKCVDKVTKNLGNLSDDFVFLPHVYFELGKIHRRLGDIKNCIKYMVKALNSAKTFKYHDLIIDTLDEFTMIDSELLPINLRDEFIMLTSIIGDVNKKVMVSITKYYAKRREVDTVIEICDFCQKFVPNI
ncbi:helix-turn-helix domain-containing protein [Clostridium felsineum]|uniref:Uncharacterized protein n=1 Tax=Clostridium felsineum TaxID=36839 RepID=A0A1S8LD21_9CLOT|nr:helix-turn-helix domain-containing protein [Clostridium felsineum]URZ08952.1 hypothetical protein CLROS_043560 [Clostridium felsineum]URZ09580.1 hypothetical protein CROST_002610 [Clostridium felsineum]